MSSIQWFNAIEKVRPYTFKILTPHGSGTGFQMSYSKKNSFCGIATAYHVVAHAHEWEETIKIQHFLTKKSLVLKTDDRVIIPFPDRDLAFILFNKKDLPVEETVPEIVPAQTTLKQGVEIGWCGFPAIAPNDLCFFAGYVSCALQNEPAYLVDGVAINGVSGGAAFFVNADTQNPVICGVITAYVSNRATGETLPGVSVVASVEPYQQMLKDLQNLEQAGEKAEEVQKKSVETSTRPTTSDETKSKEVGKTLKKTKTSTKGK